MKNWKRQIAAMLAFCMILSSTPVVGAREVETMTLRETVVVDTADTVTITLDMNSSGVTGITGWSGDTLTATAVVTEEEEDDKTPVEPEEPTTFTVTFDHNDGTNKQTEVVAEEGKSAKEPTLTYEGNDFQGWFTAATGGSKVTDFSSAMTVYAQWKKEEETPADPVVVELTINADKNDPDGTIKPSYVNTGYWHDSFILSITDGIYSDMPDVESATYDFTGWTLDGKTFTESTDVSKLKNGDTLVAQWKKKAAITVTFNADGGVFTSGSVITKDIEVGAKVDLPTNPTKADYVFGGWFTSKDGKGTEVTSSTTFQNNLEVFAYWKDDEEEDEKEEESTEEFTVKFDPNGGELSSGTTLEFETKNQKVESFVGNPSRDGYTFKGWFTSKTGSVAWSSSYVFAADTTVYAQWLDNDDISKITISEKPDTISYKAGENIDPEGLEIIVTYNDGSTETVVYDEDKNGDDFVFSPSLTTTLKTSHDELSVTYLKQANATVFITVEAADLTVTVDVEDHDGDEVTGATIKLYQGSTTKYAATDNKDGSYTFPAVESGNYNMILTYGDHVRTFLVTVGSKDVDFGTIELTEQPVMTSVNNESDVTVTTVDGLDDLALSYVEEDNEIISISMDFDDYVSAYDKDSIMLAKGSDEIIAQIFDVSLEKHTTYSDSKAENYEDLKELSQLVSFTFEIEKDYQDRSSYSIYRRHDDSVQELTTSKNTYGEYITVDSSENTVTVHTCRFSTYALVVNAEDGEEDDDYVSLIKPVTVVKTLNNATSSLSTMGTVLLDNESPVYGDRVYFTVNVNEGYLLTNISAKDSLGNIIPVTEFSTSRHYFTQLTNPVTVTVDYIGITPTTAPLTYTGFQDIPTNAYYYFYVYRCRELGLMDGTSAGIFQPDAQTSRAMVATILFSMAGNPNFYTENTFTDVENDAWYASPVLWAKSVGVISGYSDGSFRPDDFVTREEIALMFYKYAQYADVHTNTNYQATYNDFDSVATWAQDAVSWCTHRGLFSGYEGNLYVPNATSRRCDVAVSLVALESLL